MVPGRVITLDPMLIDPAAFHLDAVSPETRQFNEALQQLLSTFTPTHELTPQEARDVRRSGRGPFGPVIVSDMGVNRTIPGPEHQIPIRVFIGETVDAVYMHIHGGGWVLGAEDLNDPWNEAMASAAGVAVVSVGYRLAPENKYPAGGDDCEAAALWLLENAASEFGTSTLLIGGESAGAHLSVATALRLRDRHGYTGFVGANLAYGAYDMTGVPSKLAWTEKHLILDAETMAWFEHHVLDGTDVDLRDPDISPLYAELSGLPSALFTVGTMDPLLDDTLFMAARWVAAANEAEIGVYAGGVHAFDAFPIPIGQQARGRMHTWIRSRIDDRRR